MVPRVTSWDAMREVRAARRILPEHPSRTFPPSAGEFHERVDVLLPPSRLDGLYEEAEVHPQGGRAAVGRGEHGRDEPRCVRRPRGRTDRVRRRRRRLDSLTARPRSVHARPVPRDHQAAHRAVRFASRRQDHPATAEGVGCRTRRRRSAGRDDPQDRGSHAPDAAARGGRRAPGRQSGGRTAATADSADGDAVSYPRRTPGTR